MIKSWTESYAEVFEGKGMSLPKPTSNWAVLRNINVAPTMKQSRREYVPVIMGSLRYRAADQWRALRALLDPREEQTPEMELDFDFLQNHNLICGSAEFVAEKVLEVEDITRIQTVLADVGTVGLSKTQFLRCLELFSEQVMQRVEQATRVTA